MSLQLLSLHDAEVRNFLFNISHSASNFMIECCFCILRKIPDHLMIMDLALTEMSNQWVMKWKQIVLFFVITNSCKLKCYANTDQTHISHFAILSLLQHSLGAESSVINNKTVTFPMHPERLYFFCLKTQNLPDITMIPAKPPGLIGIWVEILNMITNFDKRLMHGKQSAWNQH